MSCEIRAEGGLLKIVFSGTVANGDLSGAAVQVGKLEAASDVVPHRSIDLRPIDRLEIDFAGVLTLVEARRRVSLGNSIKSAIIATDIVHFGFARMFQTLMDHPQIVIAIFGDDEHALQWLKRPDLRQPEVVWHPHQRGG